MPDLAALAGGRQASLVALMRAKGGDEFRFHDRLARHARLRAALASACTPSRRARVTARIA